MTRVLHTGDTHLGYRQYQLPERREDFLTAFEQVAADAIEDDLPAVVHAGDLFHDRTPALSDIMGALSVLRRLDANGVEFLAIVGNHESKRDLQWLDLFERMGLATRLGREPVIVRDVAFYGLDFVPRAQREQVNYDFVPTDCSHTALVSHGLFEPFEHGDWDLQTILEESSVEFDAVLLGDDHTPKTRELAEPYSTWVTYCGSTERASAAEREERGYNVVVFDDGVDIRRRGLETREFVFIDLELGPTEGSELVRTRIGQEDVDDAVVIVHIDGEGDQINPAAIEQFASEQSALTTRVVDERELTEDEELSVSFADPDDAVRQRIQELGLSAAARDVDETIRASKVADSNVADTVEERVSDFIDNQDGTFFEAADGEERSTASGTTDSQDAPDAPASDIEEVPPQEDETGRDGSTGQDRDSANDIEAQETASPDSTEHESEGEESETSADEGGDDQVTMEDYL